MSGPFVCDKHGSSFDEYCGECVTDGTRETLICSAVLMPDGYVVRGHRHNDCFRTIDGMPRYFGVRITAKMQGFMTSENRFVNRADALVIFQANGGELKLGGNTLTSEELY